MKTHEAAQGSDADLGRGTALVNLNQVSKAVDALNSALKGSGVHVVNKNGVTIFPRYNPKTRAYHGYSNIVILELDGYEDV